MLGSWYFQFTRETEDACLSLLQDRVFHNDLNLLGGWLHVSVPRSHSSISQSFAWAEGSWCRTHFRAWFLSLSHLSHQDHYTSLTLASRLLPNKAPGGEGGMRRRGGVRREAYGQTAAYTSHISHFCFTPQAHRITHNGLLIFIMCIIYTAQSGIMCSTELENYTHCST